MFRASLPWLVLTGGCFFEPPIVDQTDGGATAAPTGGDASAGGESSAADETSAAGETSSPPQLVDVGEARRCGDGVLDAAEVCDDANVLDDDGCDHDCQPSDVIAVDGGSDHFCVLTRVGSVLCWGDDSGGQLGNASFEDLGDDPGEAPDDRVQLRLPAAAVSAGGSHTCALLQDGAVVCWGDLVGGGIGGAIGDFPLPEIPIGGRAVAVAVGWGNDCALLDDGTVRCWGHGAGGTLGQGDVRDIIPTFDHPPPALDLGELHPTLLACGLMACCAAHGAEVRCWGQNFDGLLGIGGPPDLVVGDTPGDMPPLPVDDVLVLDASSLVVGLSACKVTTGGDTRCWGSNSAGALGTGDTVAVIGGIDDPPVGLPLASNTTAVVAGVQHICALSHLGDVRCLGTGYSGANGAATGASIGDDLGEVPPPPLPLPAPAVLLGATSYSTCAWLENHEMWCWGENDHGQLGRGDAFAIGDDEPITAGSPVPLFLPHPP